MKLIDPSYEILEQQSGLQGIYKQIELAGRTCYKSEDKITDTSAEAFVQRMIDSKHTAMLEHGTVYLTVIPDESYKYVDNPYTKIEYNDRKAYITTNLRVIVENNWLDDLKYICEPTKYHHKRYTVKLTTSLHVYKDITRHRKVSFAIESTRYCNYSKGKYGSELTFIKPIWGVTRGFLGALTEIEVVYLDLINNEDWKAQQAAELLPQCIKADVIMTAFDTDWQHIFNLRANGTTGAPHPEVKRIFEPLMQEFIDRKYINDTSSNIDNSNSTNS